MLNGGPLPSSLGTRGFIWTGRQGKTFNVSTCGETSPIVGGRTTYLGIRSIKLDSKSLRNQEKCCFVAFPASAMNQVFEKRPRSVIPSFRRSHLLLSNFFYFAVKIKNSFKKWNPLPYFTCPPPKKCMIFFKKKIVVPFPPFIAHFFQKLFCHNLKIISNVD